MYASVIHSTLGGIYIRQHSKRRGSTWTRLANPPRTEGHPFNINVLNRRHAVCTYQEEKLIGAVHRSSAFSLATDAAQPGSIAATQASLLGLKTS